MTDEMVEQLKDGVVYDGAEIGASLKGVEICLTMLNLPVERVDYAQWLAKTRRKPRRANSLLNVQICARELDHDFWTFLGHFGAMGDEINYDWFNTAQVHDLMMWLDNWCGELGFCAPLPGSSCHRDAPRLPAW